MGCTWSCQTNALCSVFYEFLSLVIFIIGGGAIVIGIFLTA